MDEIHIEIEILADGTIKSTPSEVSGPNHRRSAEQFFRMLSELTRDAGTLKQTINSVDSDAV